MAREIKNKARPKVYATCEGGPLDGHQIRDEFAPPADITFKDNPGRYVCTNTSDTNRRYKWRDI